GVPSLFSDLSPLYDHPGKADILEKFLLGLEDSIKTTGGYPGRSEKEPPSTLMWTLFYLAQHYDRRGLYDIALAKIDEAMQHTPTVIDLYTTKSKILKHGGDFTAAAALADEARCMDLADRYVNSHCVKRMLQADQVPLAEKTAVLFTKDGEQHNNLHDMQCMWYELASGDSYVRQGELGLALKNFLAVEKHYADITEDQFDFHSYCLRKMTLRSYIEMLRFQDRLHAHSYFRKAAVGAIRCYIKLYDAPTKLNKDDELSKLPASQKKKLRQKQRKAEARAKKEVEVKNAEINVGGVSKSQKKRASKLIHMERSYCRCNHFLTEDPILKAGKYLKLLQKHSSDYLETHLLSFEVNMRKQKILLALQALKQLQRLDAENPDSHRCLLRFFHKVASRPAPATDGEKLIMGVIEVERPTFCQLHGKSLVEANTVFLDVKHKDSLMHRAGSGWKTRCAEYFPYSTYFEGQQCSTHAANKDCKQAHTENVSIESFPSNGKVEKLHELKNLTI
ncbi:N-alpha-acetyltransferase 15, NatA auxiliary subunit, partial [Tanacetum coccineum]